MKLENFLNKMDSVADAGNWDKLIEHFTWYVKAVDPRMSGWGLAPNKSYVIVLCHDNYNEVDAVMRGLEKDKMKYITCGRIENLTSFPRKQGCHYSLYFAPNTYWYKKNATIYSSSANEPSRKTRYKATEVYGHKVTVSKPKIKSKKIAKRNKTTLKATKVNLTQEIWEGWTIKDIIEENIGVLDMIANGQSWQQPFKNKTELKKYLKDHIMPADCAKPTAVNQLTEFFAKRYGIKN